MTLKDHCSEISKEFWCCNSSIKISISREADSLITALGLLLLIRKTQVSLFYGQYPLRRVVLIKHVRSNSSLMIFYWFLSLKCWRVLNIEFNWIQWSIKCRNLCEPVEGNLTPDNEDKSGVSVIKGTVHD